MVTDRCVKCKKCINDLGCPAIVFDHDRIKIEKSLCFGCALCAEVCPTGAILPAERKPAEWKKQLFDLRRRRTGDGSRLKATRCGRHGKGAGRPKRPRRSAWHSAAAVS